MGAQHAPFGGSADCILRVISLLMSVWSETLRALSRPHRFPTCVILRPRANYLLLMTFHPPLDMV